MSPSRKEVESHVAMIMIQLPFPPLPILVINAQGEERMASSHDLLSQALCLSVLATHTPEDIIHRKQFILNQINTKISNMWSLEVAKFIQDTMYIPQPSETSEGVDVSNKSIYDKAWQCAWRSIPIKNCYDIYCICFREYMACYPGSRDLRIYPLEDVTNDTAVYKQAVLHLKAREAYIPNIVEFDKENFEPNSTNSTFLVPKVKPEIHNYADLLRLYAMGMFLDSN